MLIDKDMGESCNHSLDLSTGPGREVRESN